VAYLLEKQPDVAMWWQPVGSRPQVCWSCMVFYSMCSQWIPWPLSQHLLYQVSEATFSFILKSTLNYCL
jgi:hypothetical protein